jgi:CRISPR-associated protein Cas1
MMLPGNLHILPRVQDSYGWLYVEQAIIEREGGALAIHTATGVTYAPCAMICFLMLGPGVSISHAAVSLLAEHGCSVGWTGEAGVRLYAAGLGETRTSCRLLHQAKMWADKSSRMLVVRNLYKMRFATPLDPHLTLRQIRGMEGKRVRETYARMAEETGVVWRRRNYTSKEWNAADPINRALSSAHACLYGICHAAIVSAGYSPAIGFIHTGTMLAFVYDIADLYKTDTTIPTAFRVVSESPLDVERRVRIACRDIFHKQHLLAKIVNDIHTVLQLPNELESEENTASASKLTLWDPSEDELSAGKNYADSELGQRETSDGCHDSREGPDKTPG